MFTRIVRSWSGSVMIGPGGGEGVKARNGEERELNANAHMLPPAPRCGHHLVPGQIYIMERKESNFI